MDLVTCEPVVDGLHLGSIVEAVAGPTVERGLLTDYDRPTDSFRLLGLDGSQHDVQASSVRAPPLKRPGQGGSKDSWDLLLGPRTIDDVVSSELSSCLMEKGFCVVKLIQSLEDVARTVEHVRYMSKEGKLGRLPEEVEEGYLGACGKGKVAWLDPTDPEAPDDELLAASDATMSYLADMFGPSSEDVCGKLLVERTPALLSFSLSDAEEEEFPYPIADDRVLGDFLGTWRRGLVRIVHFFGPATVSVTLESRSSAAADKLPVQLESLEVETAPNTILIYRPDCFSYAADAEGEFMTLMSTLLSMSPDFQYVEWRGDLSQLSGDGLGPSPPVSQENVNVMCMHTRLSGCWDEIEYYRAGLSVATDAAVEIPITRFDVAVYWCPDPDDLFNDPNRTTQRHLGFIEGVELFDNKYFEISNNESMQMGPMQRQVLECGGGLLHLFGISKKRTNKEPFHAGCSVGMDKDDYPSLGIGYGGSNVVAIIGNRFSFTFNLKGPNFVCDTACSASLVATHIGRLMLLERKWDPLDFHIAIGTHLCLSPAPYIGNSLGRMCSPEGRCFTFNATANGYLRGEGSSGMILKYGSLPTERLAIMRASQAGQNGRSATLTAPNGPAQEMIISRAYREAGIQAPESTAWDCHGTGTSLGDPIEVGTIRRIQVKSARTEPLMTGTNKTNVGHMEGGAAMTTMIKTVLQVQFSTTLPLLHLSVMNPHLEHESFDSNFINELQAWAHPQGNGHVSSFGFGGTNGHMIMWGKNLSKVPNLDEQLLRRVQLLAAPEVRPIGNSPDEWETDGPEQQTQPGDRWYISIDATDPANASARWVKEDVSLLEEEEEDSFYSVTGNFNEWRAERMDEGDLAGVRTATLQIPESGVLEFHFLKDGEADQVLAPSMDKCMKKTAPIIGPEAGLTNVWAVRGQPGDKIRIELFAKENKNSLVWFLL